MELTSKIERLLPEEIEKRSFEIISEEFKQRGIVLPTEQEMITKRVIHTSADFDYAYTMTYSENAVSVTISAPFFKSSFAIDTAFSE